MKLRKLYRKLFKKKETVHEKSLRLVKEIMDNHPELVEEFKRKYFPEPSENDQPLYEENDLVIVKFERGEEVFVILGRPKKMYNEKHQFLGWSYDSKTSGINWVNEKWIEEKVDV